MTRPRRVFVLTRQLVASSVLLSSITACVGGGSCESNEPPRAECDSPDAASDVSVDGVALLDPRSARGAQGSDMLLFDVQVTGDRPPTCAGVDYVVRSAASGEVLETGSVALEMTEASGGGTLSRESHWMFWSFSDAIDLEVTAYGHTDTARVCHDGCSAADGGTLSDGGAAPDGGGALDAGAAPDAGS